MCSAPLSDGHHEFACRVCDECVAARRMDWIARCMAERSTSKQTLAITLTYGNETQDQRDGAAMFRYYDIQNLLKVLRRRIHYRTGQVDALRYVCAGEQGDRNGRCHWHIIIFSDHDLLEVGTFKGRFGPVTDRAKIISGAKPKRYTWDCWPHGFVVVQEPDQGGISYAVTYALKDQFTAEKSKGTARETKVETFATGMFRMSKTPPIGWNFVQAELQRMKEGGYVLPFPRLQIPDFRADYWSPKATLRHYLLEGMRDINREHREREGVNLPQWRALLAACSENDNDMEILLHGEEIETEDETSIERELNLRAREFAERQRIGRVLTRCGSSLPCTSCLRGFGRTTLDALGVEPYQTEGGQQAFRNIGDQTGHALWEAQRDRKGAGKPHPRCGLRNTSFHAGVYS